MGAKPLAFRRAAMASARAFSLNTPTWMVKDAAAPADGGAGAVPVGGMLDATRVGGGRPVPAAVSGLGVGFAAAAGGAEGGILARGTFSGFTGPAPGRGRSRVSSTLSPSRRCA